jgi:drug/metabolite transporter (DMT)-like permease
MIRRNHRDRIMTTPPIASALPVSIPDPLKGILLMVAAMLVIPINDGIAKSLTAHYPVAEIVWARYTFHFLLLLPFIVPRHGWGSLIPARGLWHVLRGACTVSTTFFFFLSLAKMPMANTLALIFAYPLIVTALSPWLLSEKVGLRRWLAVIAGMAGTAIIVRPGTDVFQWWSLLGLAAALCNALYWVITRKVTGSAPPLVGAAYAALFGVFAMPLVLPGGWVMPTFGDAALLAVMGAIAAGYHILMVKALDFAPASTLAPFAYAEMINATSIGYFVFGDFPDAWTWAGIAIVIAAGIYISLRERRRRGEA